MAWSPGKKTVRSKPPGKKKAKPRPKATPAGNSSGEMPPEAPDSAAVKRERFIAAYSVRPNAAWAAREAGFISDHRNQAYRLLREPAVRAAIEAMQAKYREEMDVNARRVIGNLLAEAEGAEKASDRIKAWELIGRHLGLFVDRSEISGPNGGAVEVSDARARLAKLLSGSAESRDTGSAGETAG